MGASGGLVTTVERLARGGPSLEVTANLSVTIDGITLAISTVGDRLRVQIPSAWAVFRLFRSERERLPALSRALSEAGLTAEIRVGSAVVAVVGQDAAPGTLSKLFASGAVEIRFRALAPAVLRLR